VVEKLGWQGSSARDAHGEAAAARAMAQFVRPASFDSFYRRAL
jgi:hypothetical protein